MESGVSWGDVCGIAGVVLYVGSYFGLQAGLIKGHGYAYATVNTVAAVFVLLSLVGAFNLSSAIIQVVWIVIGVFGMVRYYLQTSKIRFSDEEKVFLKVVAPGLEKLDARRLLDLGRWKTMLSGVELTLEEEHPEHLHFFLAGSAEVTVNDRKVGIVGPTSLVGEAAFLTGESASATVTVTRPSRVFSIRVNTLREAAKNRKHAPESITAPKAMKMPSSRGVKRRSARNSAPRRAAIWAAVAILSGQSRSGRSCMPNMSNRK